jgi:type VI secretion system secreted protein VgrG
MRKYLLVLVILLIAFPAWAGVITKCTGDLPDRIHMKVFDTAVNTGVLRAKKILQEALNDFGAGLKVDGNVGLKTRLAICGKDEDVILAKYAAKQADFYRSIVARKPNQAKFLKGWLRRAAWVPK